MSKLGLINIMREKPKQPDGGVIDPVGRQRQTIGGGLIPTKAPALERLMPTKAPVDGDVSMVMPAFPWGDPSIPIYEDPGIEPFEDVGFYPSDGDTGSEGRGSNDGPNYPGRRYYSGSGAYGGYYGVGGPPSRWGNDDYASEMRAWIARQEWNDYLSRFAPIEDELIGTIGNEELLNEQLSQAEKNINAGYTAAKNQSDIDKRRYGLNLHDRQSRQENAELELNKTAKMAQALNDVRISKRDRDLAIMGGGVSQVKDNRLGG